MDAPRVTDLSGNVGFRPGVTYMKRSDFTEQVQEDLMRKHFNLTNPQPVVTIPQDRNSIDDAELARLRKQDEMLRDPSKLKQLIDSVYPHEIPRSPQSQPVAQPASQPVTQPAPATPQEPQSNDWLDGIFSTPEQPQSQAPVQARPETPIVNPVQEKPDPMQDFMNTYKRELTAAAISHGIDPVALDKFTREFSMQKIADIFLREQQAQPTGQPAPQTQPVPHQAAQPAMPNLAELKGPTQVTTYRGIMPDRSAPNSIFNF